MKILLLRFSSAGDIILTTPLINKLKLIKHAAVYLMVKEENAAPAALTGAKVLAVNVKKGLSSVVAAVNSLSPDVIIDLQGNFRSRYITFFAGAKEKYTYSKDVLKRRLMVLFKWFLNDTLKITDRYIMTAEKLLNRHGIDTAVRPVKRTSKGKGVLIHGGAKWPLKRWPYVHELARLLAEKKIKVTLTGLKDEVDNSAAMVYHKHKYISDLTGKTNFEALAALVKKSGAVVCNDSVVAHLAGLYSVPCAVFMGPTSEAFGFVSSSEFLVLQNDLLCRPCHIHGGGKCPVETFECMKDISAIKAAKAITAIIKKR